MVKRVVVGAHYGLRDWLGQRVTAIFMALYLLLLVIVLLAVQPQGYEGWRAIFTLQGMRVLTALFFTALFYHAWVGMRDILMDYIQATILRLSLEVLVIVCLAAYALWALEILWSA